MRLSRGICASRPFAGDTWPDNTIVQEVLTPPGLHPDIAAAMSLALTVARDAEHLIRIARNQNLGLLPEPNIRQATLPALARLRALWGRQTVIDTISVSLTRASDDGFGAENAHVAAYQAGIRVWAEVFAAIDEANSHVASQNEHAEGCRQTIVEIEGVNSPCYGPQEVRRHLLAVLSKLAAAHWPDWSALRAAVKREAMKASIDAPPPAKPKNAGGRHRKQLSPEEEVVFAIWVADPSRTPLNIVDELRPSSPKIKASEVKTLIRRWKAQRSRTSANSS